MKQISKLQKLHPQMRIRNYMSTIQKNIKTFEPKKKKNSQMTSYQQNPIKKIHIAQNAHKTNDHQHQTPIR